jgi:hypothetical protein
VCVISTAFPALHLKLAIHTMQPMSKKAVAPVTQLLRMVPPRFTTCLEAIDDLVAKSGALR